MPTRAALATRAALFAALGDPLRLKIADELATSDRTPGELLEWVDVSSALLAHHLDVLEAAGVIERTTSHADGRKRFVRLVPQHRHLLAPFGWFGARTASWLTGELLPQAGRQLR
ncbi:MAG: ArsR family transcriptional regulator, partial [Actinobacteria bacterium]|nr:ArsR family transcriptional regulator [Actinomycetota bacterium]